MKLSVLFILLPLFACTKKGPLEQFGEEIDEGVEDIRTTAAKRLATRSTIHLMISGMILKTPSNRARSDQTSPHRLVAQQEAPTTADRTPS